MLHLRSVLTGLFSLTLAAAAFAAAPDWPCFHGPKGDNISPEKGLLQQWPAGGPTLAWQISGLGKGYSTVSIAGDKIYTLGERDGGTQFLIALGLADHKELWAAKVGPKCTDGGHPGPRGAPTVDGDMVYVIGTDGDLVAVSTAGKEVWRKNLQRDLGGKMMSMWNYSESPLVDGDNVICTPGGNDSQMAALNKKTGAVVWKAAGAIPGDKGKAGSGYSSIVISNAAGVKQYVTLTGKGMIGVDAKTGKLLWTYNKVANNVANIPSAVIKDDYVFCSSGYKDGGAALLKLSSDGGGIKCEEVYWLDPGTFQNHHGGMILLGDYLYAGHGHNKGLPVCLEFKTGKVVWQAPKQPGRGSAALSYADGCLYFRNEDGQMVLVEATPTGYQEKSAFKLASVLKESWSHVVFHDGKMYARDQDVLMCYDVKAK